MTVIASMLNAGNVTLRAKLDSATLLMGNVTSLHLEIIQDKGTSGVMNIDRTDTLNAMVEIAARIKPDTSDIGNNREQIMRDLIIQSFDSGLYVLPPVQYVVGRDTFSSNPLTLKVIPVKVDSLQNIHDYKPVHEVPFKLLDFVPAVVARYWWLILLVLLLTVAAAYAYFKWFSKGKNPFKSEEKQLPPYDEAMQRLQALKARNLWQNGQEKEYYTEITDILRNYIDRRFDINAVEMTTTQIVDTLKRNEETRAVNEQLKDILEIADFVKFAKVRPLADENEGTYRRAVDFVEQTKPEEPAEDTEDTDAEQPTPGEEAREQ